MVIAVDTNNVKWFGPHVRFNGETWDVNDDGFISTIDYANDAALAPDGTLLFGTDYGLLHYTGEGEFPTVVETQTPQPQPFEITGVYPNPFNNATTVTINSTLATHADIRIYNLLGQSVRSIPQLELRPGVNSLIWDGANDDGNIVSSGKYFIQVKSGGYSSSAGVTFLR